MRGLSRAALSARILWEIARYELVFAAQGFEGVQLGLRRLVSPRERDTALEAAICRAFDTVSSFYWKQMVCLQRSVITARVMHSYGIPADVVIGYRFAPFVGHAWVEIKGIVVNDSSGYAEKLQVLERIGPAASEA